MSLVWLVDDSDLEREIARRSLSKRHQVVEFTSGDAILERVSQGEIPDVLVIDYHLPNLSGLEVTQHLRRRLGPTELPVLVLSSTYTASEDIVAGLEAGANDYVLKPFAEIELLARVEALAQAKRQRERADLAERSLRKLLLHLPDAFLAVDLDGRITFVNREAERILGQEWAALLLQPLAGIIPRLGEVHHASAGTAPFNVDIGNRSYEPAFGRLVIDEQQGETVTVTLRDVTEKLQAIDRRDRFLAMLGHELRNPLSPILSATQMIQRHGDEPGLVTRATSIIQRQVERLIRIVDDLLDVSRVSRGRIEIHPEPVDVSVLIDRALESSQPLLQSRRHVVVWQPPSEPLWALADPLRFEQMLTNLVANAAKYTGDRGEIRIDARALGDDIVIRVRDNGVGIPADMLEGIFELFVQIDDSLNRSDGGLGIGLPLVRQLALLHGGSVQAHSDGPGKGSEFVLRLPAARARTATAVAAQTSAPAATGHRVLLVDDNTDVVELIAEALIRNGHDVRVAYDGSTALAVAQEFRPEVAFLDIGLPGCDGYEVARQMRVQGQRCLLVAVTGYGQPEHQARAREAGFDQHLVKPITFATVENILASSPVGAARQVD